MKVAFLSTSLGPHDVRFLEAIASFGEVHHVLTEPPLRLDDRPTSARSCIHLSGTSLMERASELRRWMSDVQPDIVHAGPLQSAALVARVALEGRPTPLVAMSWGFDILLAEPDSVYDDIASWVLDGAQALVADCQTALGRSRNVLSYQGRTLHFPWGVELTQFPCKEFRSATQERFVILSTRNWEPVYDVPTLVKAFTRIASSDSTLRLVLAGSGSLEAKIKTLLQPVETQVSLLGRVPYETLPAVYREADLYISTSKTDGSSVSLLEAMSSGLDVLVSDIPSNHEWVTMADRFFPFGDIDALVDKIFTIRHQPLKERARRGQIHRSKVESEADWTRVPQKLETLYRELLS